MSDTLPWFKFYHDDFMKGIRGLSDEEVGFYVKMICVMYECGGPVKDCGTWLSLATGTHPRTLNRLRAALIAKGKLIAHDGVIYNQRAAGEIEQQKQVHENRAQAARKRRNKKAKRETNSELTQNELNSNAVSSPLVSKKVSNNNDPPAAWSTEPESEPDIDSNLVPNGTCRKRVSTLTKTAIAKSCAARWNAFAAEHNLSEVKRLSKQRVASIAARLTSWTEGRSLEDFEATFDKALERVLEADWMFGGNDRGWIVTFDFLCQESSFNKLMEGVYARSSKRPLVPKSREELANERWLEKTTEHYRNAKPAVAADDDAFGMAEVAAELMAKC